MSLLSVLPQVAWQTSLYSVCGFAFWRGGRPERIVAAVAIIAWIAAWVVQNKHDWVSTQWGSLVVDSLLLAVLVGLALRTDRRWLLFAAAFQLISVVIYIARMVDPRVGALAPYRGGVIWSYAVLVSLAVGTWLHWRGGRQT